MLNSAIKKLRLVTLLPEKRLLYRGLTGMAMPDDVLAIGSFVEFAFSSATPDPYVAKSYAGSDRASIFEIRVGKIDCGADIEEYSQYEMEKEHVLPPLSHFEIVGRRREFGTNVYILDLNINLRARTLEELHESRRTTALEIANKVTKEFLILELAL